MPESLLFALCAAAYFALAWLFWPGRAACCTQSWAVRGLPWLPFALHAWLLYGDVYTGSGIALGFAVSLSAVAALTVLTHSLAAWRYPLGGLLGLVLAFAGAMVLLHGAMRDATPVPHSDRPLFAAHLIVALTAYSLYTIAALQALLMATVEKHLHRPVPPRLVTALPPLLTLERLLFHLIGAGFVLLTLTLVSGVFFAEELFGQPLPFNHKTVFGLTSWVVFGVLLAGRRLYGWRGRTAITWTLAGFVFLLLAYVGVKFVLEVILRRT
ncbi:MAG: cytochrome c biogenesis protein CcsA [Burkholderiales bacterium]|nr:cytochrome c biogenesis protein CcsA [Burkholderiales bacterium]